MPMDRSRYPANWDEIAQAVKDEANWQCEDCHRPCRRPGVSWVDFCLQILETRWFADTCEEVHDEETGEWGVVERRQRFTLTVAHLDHVPENCDRRNLKALCAPCHCRMDLKAMQTKKRLKAERLGQLSLGV